MSWPHLSCSLSLCLFHSQDAWVALVATGTGGLTRAAEQVLQLYVASKGRLMDQQLQAYLTTLDVAAERVPLEVHDSILELLHLLVEVQAEVFNRAPPSELLRVRPRLHIDSSVPVQNFVCVSPGLHACW